MNPYADDPTCDDCESTNITTKFEPRSGVGEVPVMRCLTCGYEEVI